MKKFLIGQLGRYGDCLYATTVARQIKNDFPASHITWAIAPQYRSIIEHNPHVDEIWEVEVPGNDLYYHGFKKLEKEALAKKKMGMFDELVFTQVPDSNWIRFDGTIRSSILKGYPRPITVPVDPVVRITPGETANVAAFAASNRLSSFRHVILFECNPGSNQSYVTPVCAKNNCCQWSDLFDPRIYYFPVVFENFLYKRNKFRVTELLSIQSATAMLLSR